MRSGAGLGACLGSDYFRRIRFFIRASSDDGVATRHSHTTARSTTRVEPRGGIASDEEVVPKGSAIFSSHALELSLLPVSRLPRHAHS